jgi:hypothetical protein
MILVFILLGCENNKSAATNTDQLLEVTEYHSVNVSNTTTNTDHNIKSTNNFKGKQLLFTKFILNISYEKDQSTEIRYEKKSIGIEAKMIDTQTKEKIIGKDAFSKIQPLLLKLKLHKGTPASDVKQEVISLFKIRDDYQKIELELGFADGAENKFTFTP